MTRICSLNTHGYQANFIFTPARFPGSIYSAVEFVLHPSLGDVKVKSSSELIYISELQRLVDYFHTHIEALQEKRDPRSIIFVTEGLNFFLQALIGPVKSDGTGRFDINILVKIGYDPVIGKPVDVGGQAQVDISQIRAFQADLLSIIDEDAQ